MNVTYARCAYMGLSAIYPNFMLCGANQNVCVYATRKLHYEIISFCNHVLHDVSILL